MDEYAISSESNFHGLIILPRAAKMGAILSCIATTCLTFSGYDRALCAALNDVFSYCHWAKGRIRITFSIVKVKISSAHTCQQYSNTYSNSVTFPIDKQRFNKISTNSTHPYAYHSFVFSRLKTRCFAYRMHSRVSIGCAFGHQSIKVYL